MAVAVKNAAETSGPALSERRPAVVGLLGMAYVLGSIAIVYYLIPALWWNFIGPALNEFASIGLELFAGIGAAIGLVVLGARLGGGHLPPGARAGTFVSAAGLLTIAFITWLIGEFLQAVVFPNPALWMVGFGISLGLGIVLLAWATKKYLSPGFDEFLVQFEEQGWFSGTSYKKSQGLRVRRGTTAGILILAGCGIYTLLAHQVLTTGPKHWIIMVPFLQVSLAPLRDLAYTVPILLVSGALWLGWRLVNFPMFADFLIATEAELNKVSWTPRKRLYQDTIVVLSTVILLTVFLFLVDWMWFTILKTNIPGLGGVGVLKVDTSAKKDDSGQKEVPW